MCRVSYLDAEEGPQAEAEARVVGSVLVFRDISGRRRAERALREAGAILRSFYDTAPVMMGVVEVVDDDILHLTDNDATGRFFGTDPERLAGRRASELGVPPDHLREWVRRYRESERTGQPVRFEYERVWGRSCQSLYDNPRSFMDAVHPDDRERVRADVLERQSRGEQIDKEYRVVRPDGSIRWVRDRAFPVKNAEGQFYRLVGIIDDFTERKKAEEALKEANRRKDEFLATLAHELRNPLAPIRNAVELMRRANGDGAMTEMARSMMERQVGQMVRLVDDLLDISRITRGKLHLRRERIELAPVVRSAVEASRPVIDAHAHDLTVTLPPEPIHLEADPIRLAQVFSNLLNNAAKYTESGGHIWLTAERRGAGVGVAVRDTGIGIAAEHLPHVFEMFSQAAPALERSQGGLGIGLALVQGLVELHGGSVEARSAGPGKGSELTLRLPALEKPVPARQEPSGGGEILGAGPKCRILVADDLGDSADSLTLVLRLAGHEVQTAHDGLEAVQAAAVFRPDVVLLDIGMPKMNGYPHRGR